MRILIVTQYFWPEEFFINDLSYQLQEKGNEVEILTGIPNYPTGHYFQGYGLTKRHKESYKGIPIKRAWLIPRGKGGKINLVLNYLSFVIFASLKVLNPYYRKFDRVFVYEVSPITQALPAMLLRKIAKIPVCLYVLDLWPDSIQAAGNINNELLLNLTGKLVKFIYRRCDSILVSSRSFCKHIQSYGFPEERLDYLPSWADQTFQPIPKAPIELAEINREKFNLMYAGNIGSAQGFDIVIAAAEQLKGNEKIHFVVLGDGRKREYAEKEARRKGLHNISFLGRKPVDTMSSFFCSADVLLVTLKKEYIFSLTMPARVQSFMACGRPIIASVDGETADIINESGAGIVSSAEDLNGFVEAINKLYHMTVEERDALGAKGLAYSKEQFSKDKLINRLINILESVHFNRA